MLAQACAALCESNRALRKIARRATVGSSRCLGGGPGDLTEVASNIRITIEPAKDGVTVLGGTARDRAIDKA
jgi:hypothetical protein